MLLKQFAEMISIVIPHRGCHFLNAAVTAAFQQLLGFFQTDINQVPDRSVPCFALKYFGNIKGAEVHIFGNLIQRNLDRKSVV